MYYMFLVTRLFVAGYKFRSITQNVGLLKWMTNWLTKICTARSKTLHKIQGKYDIFMEWLDSQIQLVIIIIIDHEV